MNNRFPALHGLRVIAILGVIQLHSMHQLWINALGIPYGTPTDSFLYNSSFNSWFAMDLFFVLSGFLIGQILIHSKEVRQNLGFGRFYVRRALRTLPLYFFFLFSYFFITLYPAAQIPNVSTYDSSLKLEEIFFLTNYPPYRYLVPWSWSLSAEEHFYLLCPLLISVLFFFKSHKKRLCLLLGLWSLGPVVRYWIYTQRFPAMPENVFVFMYIPTHARFDIFVVGIFLAYLNSYFSNELSNLFKRRGVQLLALLLPLSIFLFIQNPFINPNPLGQFQEPATWAWTWQSGIFYFGTLTGIGYSLIILFAIYTHNPITEFLSSRWFLKFATLGYGIYLVHMIVAALFACFFKKNFANPQEHIFAIWILITAGTFIFSAVFAYLMHILIEKPFLRLRDWLVP